MMKEFKSELIAFNISLSILVQSVLITPGTSASGASPDNYWVPKFPANELSGPTLKFRPLQQGLRDQQLKAKTPFGVNFRVSDLKQSNLVIKPDVIKDTCDRYDVDGCSIPYHLPFFFKTLFTPSCNRHDICYHCGVSRGITRIVCDQAFRENMQNACMRNYHEDKPWDSRFSHKNPKQTKEHRVAVRQLIKSKTQLLTEVMANLTHEIKKDVGDSLRFLTSPDKVNWLRENVLIEWTLLLRELLSRDHAESIDSLTPKSIGNDRADNNYKRALFKRHALFMERNRSSHYKNSSRVLSESKHDPRGIDTKPISVESTEQDLCTKILKRADENMSTDHRHYKASNVLDCEDVHLLECLSASDVYFLAVRLFGSSSYHKTAEFYCNDGFVPQCLPHS